MKKNMVGIKEPQNFYFYFDLAQDVDKTLKHEVELIR